MNENDLKAFENLRLLINASQANNVDALKALDGLQSDISKDINECKCIEDFALTIHEPDVAWIAYSYPLQGEDVPYEQSINLVTIRIKDFSPSLNTMIDGDYLRELEIEYAEFRRAGIYTILLYQPFETEFEFERLLKPVASEPIDFFERETAFLSYSSSELYKLNYEVYGEKADGGWPPCEYKYTSHAEHSCGHTYFSCAPHATALWKSRYLCRARLACRRC